MSNTLRENESKEDADLNTLIATKLFGIKVIGLAPVNWGYEDTYIEVQPTSIEECKTNKPGWDDWLAPVSICSNYNSNTYKNDSKHPWEEHFGIPYIFLQPVLNYCMDTRLASEVEDRVCSLANFNGKVVGYSTVDSNGTRRQRGLCLRESYIANLIRVVNPHLKDFAQTTMGHNNWFDIRFRSEELMSIARATPIQRCMAALATIGDRVIEIEPDLTIEINTKELF